MWCTHQTARKVATLDQAEFLHRFLQGCPGYVKGTYTNSAASILKAVSRLGDRKLDTHGRPSNKSFHNAFKCGGRKRKKTVNKATKPSKTCATQRLIGAVTENEPVCNSAGRRAMYCSKFPEPELCPILTPEEIENFRSRFPESFQKPTRDTPAAEGGLPPWNTTKSDTKADHALVAVIRNTQALVPSCHTPRMWSVQ